MSVYQYETLVFDGEHTLFSYLNEYLDANGQTPHIAGVDFEDNQFFAWLSTYSNGGAQLRTLRLQRLPDGTSDTIRGGKLAYPVVTLVAK